MPAKRLSQPVLTKPVPILRRGIEQANSGRIGGTDGIEGILVRYDAVKIGDRNAAEAEPRDVELGCPQTSQSIHRHDASPPLWPIGVLQRAAGLAAAPQRLNTCAPNSLSST
jgi:hypothetical protein